VSDAYAPPRHIGARIGRRVTQWRAARPADLISTRPLLSIAFDDFPASAARVGAPLLAELGVRGSFYASAGLAEQDGPCGMNFSRGDLLAVSEAGHEIGCHGFAHADAARLPVRDALLDLAKNADAIAEMGHKAPLRTLAYPYGETRFGLKQALPMRFIAARGVLKGVNAGRVDRAQLRACTYYGPDAFDSVRELLVEAARTNGWLIAFTHDVGHWPSKFGTTPKALTALVRAAGALGFDIAPVADIAARAFEDAPCAA